MVNYDKIFLKFVQVLMNQLAYDGTLFDLKKKHCHYPCGIVGHSNKL